MNGIERISSLTNFGPNRRSPANFSILHYITAHNLKVEFCLWSVLDLQGLIQVLCVLPALVFTFTKFTSECWILHLQFVSEQCVAVVAWWQLLEYSLWRCSSLLPWPTATLRRSRLWISICHCNCWACVPTCCHIFPNSIGLCASVTLFLLSYTKRRQSYRDNGICYVEL